MARAALRFVCSSCGAAVPKWTGRCEACGEWNTLEPETPAPGVTSRRAGRSAGRGVDFVGLAGETPLPERVPLGIAEFDRVLGGGMVPASAILVGGDPGIGKSTLLLQAAARLAGAGKRVLYISGEESVAQIRLRAERLGLRGAPVNLASATVLADILAALDAERDVAMVVIDSIQTIWDETVESAPGTVTQVRANAFALIRAAKTQGFALMLVGHVTKEGALAGPRVMEHMVDVVLHFEGDRGHQFRILRGAKNRFGATDEIGVFEMTGRGLAEVANPSALFLAERHGNVAGSAVFAGLEGSRPVLMEVQALLAANPGGSARRSVIGWDQGRLSMLLAVLDARCGVKLSAQDVYLNIAGGLRVSEPAADLAVAAALVSAATGVPTDPETVFFGEIGLSGELRQVAQAELRLKEAAKLGFARAALPRRVAGGTRRIAAPDGIALAEYGHLSDLVAATAGRVPMEEDER
ncbi:DNA repair protein RadA [Acidiphilium sp. AL]|uniref:DNA repair protein RadA n=1 Tax=Acidiphilium iwatense TaxID=768198 RepID=A0ABS9DUP8_9PROT|nr:MULTISPECIES: DNA repair protein RadA [Acidiphilium]MCF3945875.1 DNA repair protein RadA [Acidiphilium iwatense]MCU4159244.1 DNA repair protein RadA [Acidiphilium sp. AL]